MSKLIVPIIAVLLFTSCHRTLNKEDDIVITDPKPEPFTSRKGVKNVPIDLGTARTDALQELGKNLYGKFFYDRAEYYIVDRPDNKLKGKEVLRATLYYFDGNLYKVKYLLADDLSNELINERRKFKIKALDQVSRDVLKRQVIVFKTDGKLLLNENLKSYELTWDDDQKQIKWRTSMEGTGDYFEYTESLGDYKKKYRELEIFENRYTRNEGIDH